MALAQFRPVVGDINANLDRIRHFAAQAARDGVHLLACPEMALLGYPPDDLLQRPALPALLAQAMARLAASIPAGIAVLIGSPEFTEAGVYNAAWLLREGRAEVVGRKQALPNFGVFDERRHFVPGEAAGTFEHGGQRFHVLICEDLWSARYTNTLPVADGAITLIINASPFDQQKRGQRQALLAAGSARTQGAWVYVNLVGGQDELVFDGDTQVWQAGRRVSHAMAIQEGVHYQDFVAGEALPAFWGAQTQDSAAALLYRALCVGIQDYYRHNGFRHIFIGLSGGIDSALVLALAADAVGARNVTAVAMPSIYTADMSLEDAQAEAERLGVGYRVAPIAPIVEAFHQSLEPWHAGLKADSTEENLQARARGVVLMALANKAGGLVLATGNKSEMAVGYCTLYGDMCGGYAPIKDVYKTQVYELSRWRNRGGEVIPQRVITRPPSAELRPDQTDQDSLPDYAVLDPLLQGLVEEELSQDALVARGFAVADVTHVQRLLRFAEFKRRQSAPGPKVTPRAFGRERRYPITARYPDF